LLPFREKNPIPAYASRRTLTRLTLTRTHVTVMQIVSQTDYHN